MSSFARSLEQGFYLFFQKSVNLQVHLKCFGEGPCHSVPLQYHQQLCAFCLPWSHCPIEQGPRFSPSYDVKNGLSQGHLVYSLKGIWNILFTGCQQLLEIELFLCVYITILQSHRNYTQISSSSDGKHDRVHLAGIFHLELISLPGGFKAHAALFIWHLPFCKLSMWLKMLPDYITSFHFHTIQ